MVDDHCMRAALRLTPLAWIVDDERIDQRHIAQQQVGETLARKTDALTRQPLQSAVLAHMDDRVRAPPPFRLRGPQPAIEGGIVVRGRQVWRVVDGIRIDSVPAWRL